MIFMIIFIDRDGEDILNIFLRIYVPDYDMGI